MAKCLLFLNSGLRNKSSHKGLTNKFLSYIVKVLDEVLKKHLIRKTSREEGHYDNNKPDKL